MAETFNNLDHGAPGSVPIRSASFNAGCQIGRFIFMPEVISHGSSSGLGRSSG